MKTKQYIWIFSTSIVFNWFFTSNIKSQVIDKTITKETQAPENHSISIHSSHFNTKIHTWEDSKLKIEFKIHIEAKTQEKADEFYDAYIKNLITLEEKNGIKPEIVINTNSGIKSYFTSGKKEKKKITIKIKNKEYELTKFERNLIVYMPIRNELILSHKFGDVALDRLENNAKINLNHGKLFANDIKELILDARFSKEIKVGEMKKANLNLSHSQFEAGNIPTVILKASFSKKIQIGNINKANINISHSNFLANNINNLSLESQFTKNIDFKQAQEASIEVKHSNLIAEKIGVLELSGHFSKNIKIDNVDNAKIGELNHSMLTIEELNYLDLKKASFSTIDIKNSNELNILESNHTKFFIGKADIIENEKSSFSHFRINELTGRFSTIARSGNIEIRIIQTSCKKIDIEGNFTDIFLPWLKTAKVEADLTFSKFSYPKSWNLHVKEQNRNQKIYKGIIGAENTNSTNVKLLCRSCKIKIQ